MEQKTNALKTSSKVISVIMKVGYIAMIVAICICLACLIFMIATGGKTSIVIGGTTIGIAEGANGTPSEYIAMFVDYLIISGFLFVIFFLTQKMFGEISLTGEPFVEKYVKTIRIVGILIVAMTIITGIVSTILNCVLSVEALETFSEAPGIVFGAVIFCLSYIVDYGCALKNKRDSE